MGDNQGWFDAGAGMRQQKKDKEPFLIVFVTASSEEEASKIGHALVEERLAGCVNIIKDIRSIYTWKGKTEDSIESLLIIKTRGCSYPALEKKVKELHSYDVPEVIALPLERGSKAYLDWLSDATTPERS
jgi:periplasmic divalent cation tolerance protein